MAVAMPLRVTCVTGGSIASVGQVYLFIYLFILLILCLTGCSIAFVGQVSFIYLFCTNLFIYLFI